MSVITARTIVLFANQTLTSSTNGDSVNIYKPPLFQARIRLSSAGGTGTSPTLDVYVQNGFTKPAATDIEGAGTTGAVEWNDFVHFTQVTGSASVQYASLLAASNFINAAQDGALAAATIRNGPLGLLWRVKTVVGGTNPSFANVNVAVELIP